MLLRYPLVSGDANSLVSGDDNGGDIVAAITAIAMYKTGTFSKFRFFKMEDPDEVGLEEDGPGEKEPVEVL